MHRRINWRLPGILLLVLMLTVISGGSPAQAAGAGIVLDGLFDDWTGMMHITDPDGDAANDNGDIVSFYWANNPGVARSFWMIERLPSEELVYYVLYVDANNNGNFREHVDRIVIISYSPKNPRSKVGMAVLHADNFHIISWVRNNDWGESASEGGSKVEFGVSFADLGLGVGQTIRMYAESYSRDDMEGHGGGSDGEKLLERLWEPPTATDRVPDTGNVQWSPVPVLGYWGLGAAILGGGAIWYFQDRRRRRCSS